jgi:hypothetical protein
MSDVLLALGRLRVMQLQHRNTPANLVDAKASRDRLALPSKCASNFLID